LPPGLGLNDPSLHQTRGGSIPIFELCLRQPLRRAHRHRSPVAQSSLSALR
jgi:hypothetical protein